MFNAKKDYFREKLKSVEKLIWDLEFKRFKTREIREEVRQEYDSQNSKFAVIDTQIKSQLKDPTKVCEVHNPEKGAEAKHKDHGKCVCEYIDNHMDVNEIERLYDQKTLIKRDIERFLAQIKNLDLETEGSVPTPELQEGYQGIAQQLDALRELQGMLKSYVQQL